VDEKKNRKKRIRAKRLSPWDQLLLMKANEGGKAKDEGEKRM
jgi:hypothetical protein